jgi:hypothetical protein
VLYDTWTIDTDHWTKVFNSINQEHLKPLASGFKKYLIGVDDMSLDDVNKYPEKETSCQAPKFPTGKHWHLCQ